MSISIEYAYDKNGNLTRDDNKGMTFTYDLLDHPLAIVGSDNQTDYVYSADGRKFRATHTQGDNRTLIGSNGQRDQYSHFYPYVGLMGDISTNDAHSYKCGGKELDRTFGLDWYDIDARQYDAIGVPSWHKLDPLAEKYYNISPYAYCAGNPVNLVDKNGKETFYDKDGKEIYNDGIDDNKKTMVLDDTYDDINSANKVPVPSNAQLDAAEEAIKKGKKNNKEYGFVMGADGTVSNVVEGETGSVNLGPGYEELEGSSESDAHYHPFDFKMVEINGKLKPQYSDPKPSPEDRALRASREANGLVSKDSPSWILGCEPQGPTKIDASGNVTPPATRLSVCFYNATNENLEQQLYSWPKFSKAVRRINRVK